MEILLLILAVPVLWLMLTPRRLLRRASDWPLLKPMIVGAVVLAGWMLVTVMQGPPHTASLPVSIESLVAEPAVTLAEDNTPIERRNGQTQIYARGDDQLRALLQ
jgi:hypothetical protein